MILDVKCIWCGRVYEVTVEEADFKKWQSGTLIQDAMPNLSADDRELLISQTCKECF